ncbi:hypothetical protein [uncultured Nostoc sp.]|uniref:hypothetical protein n=1 Tax=uncultured Nostoc sp. TaxID=340711 RepID=UPI0035CA55DE
MPVEHFAPNLHARQLEQRQSGWQQPLVLLLNIERVFLGTLLLLWGLVYAV